MKILISIKPQFVDKIRRGEKKFEFRRVLPKHQEVDTIIVYASKPVGKVVGEMIIGDYSFLSDMFRKYDVCGLPWVWGRKRPDLLNEAAKMFAPEGVAWSNKAYTTLCRSYPLRKRERLSRFDELPINTPIEFRNVDYCAAAEDAGEDDIIYADPPYAGKSGYGVAFDNAAFWEWCRRPRCALLIISEYSAPPDFVEIWAKQVTCAMSPNGEVGRPIERLFVHKSQAERYWFELGMPTLPLQFD